MTERNQPEPPDFEEIERQQNRRNRLAMRGEIRQRSDRLSKRIVHFSEQFGLAPEDFWSTLDAAPDGPLAAVLAKEARRQNIHERAAADYISSLNSVSEFAKLPASGNRASYFNTDGQLVTKAQLGGARQPSKSVDFRWKTGKLICYAAQKYTKEGGGNQDSQFSEVELLLRNYQGRTNNDTVLFILVDGPYYNPDRLGRLRALTRTQSPYSYVSGISELAGILAELRRRE